MLLSKPFQFAYLTNDLDKALALYRDRYGMANFFTFETSGMSADPPVRVALAWTGDLMIELIEPDDAPLPHYRMEWTLGVHSIRHHHVGHLCEDDAAWDRTVKEIERRDIAVAYQGHTPGVVRFLYADTLQVDGHYREYILLDGEGGRAFFDQIPRN